MNAKEISVGDFLYCHICEKNVIVDAVTVSTVTFHHYDGENLFVGHEYLYSFKPIPLTPEILEKNGFVLIDEEDKMYRLNLAEDESVCVTADFKCEEPFVHVRNTCYQATPYCRYVHQLQHTLRLCGIEMKIEL